MVRREIIIFRMGGETIPTNVSSNTLNRQFIRLSFFLAVISLKSLSVDTNAAPRMIITISDHEILRDLSVIAKIYRFNSHSCYTAHWACDINFNHFCPRNSYGYNHFSRVFSSNVIIPTVAART